MPFAPAAASLRLGPVTVVTAGMRAEYAEEEAAAAMAGPVVAITLELAEGAATGQAWSCDLSAEYVSINADYRT